jgi:hypothetical protein
MNPVASNKPNLSFETNEMGKPHRDMFLHTLSAMNVSKFCNFNFNSLLTNRN